ncbi:MAG TPA: YbhB/YbcL family Raf kinase inhibitor-like protein [Candidatus Saccharimonadales bacterium]|nr:YbhB/YbcL family Raf kinase inhibitor-like protein [Candidatus Saccharimonadales bacterium]
MDPKNESPEDGMQITSPAFQDGETIPEQYTCRGDNVNPPLNFFNIPSGAQSLALIVHDPDAPVGDYTHWLVWDMPASTQSISPNSVPVGAMRGMNDNDDIGYMGPCPPDGTGTHRYMFELYALGRTLGLESGSSRAQLTQAMESSILSSATLTGVVAAKS